MAVHQEAQGPLLLPGFLNDERHDPLRADLEERVAMRAAQRDPRELLIHHLLRA
jgi:hypothetical protein